MKGQPLTETLRCSFCGKDQTEIRKLIAGPTVFICDECVDICNGILADDRTIAEIQEFEDAGQPNVSQEVVVNGPVAQCGFCRMPIALSYAVLIPNRGLLCLACVAEVEAAVAERRESGPR